MASIFALRYGAEGLRAPRFRCLFCDHCCYFGSSIEYPTVYPWEKRRLERLASQHRVEAIFEPAMVYSGVDGECYVALYRWVIEGYCPFFDRETKRCRIHSEKPLACRMYPLIVEMPSGRLMVSGKCDWVREQGIRLVKMLEARPHLIPRVFPDEYAAAKEAFRYFIELTRLAERLGLQPRRSSEGCKVLKDLDLLPSHGREGEG